MRKVVTVLAVVVVLLGVGLGFGGWYYTGELLPAPEAGDPPLTTEVVAVDEDDGTVTLAATEGDLVDLARVGFWTEDVALDLTEVVDRDDTSVTRTATPLDGPWPQVGDLGGSTAAVWRGDPADAFGYEVTEVVVDGPIGPLPAWSVPGDPGAEVADGTWAVLVHGRGASRESMHRTLRTVHTAGIDALVVSIRNGPDAARDPDGWGRYGDAEWEDLQAAVTYLVEERGATTLLPIGESQGGSVVLSWLRRGDHVDRASGAVLVSPLVSMRGTLDLQARNRDIPAAVIPPLLWSTRHLAALRADMDFGQLEHAERAAAYDVPMLVTHGTADSTVPFADTVALAEARPDLVRLEVYDDVEHVREWNTDPERFDADLEAFLDEVLD